MLKPISSSSLGKACRKCIHLNIQVAICLVLGGRQNLVFKQLILEADQHSACLCYHRDGLGTGWQFCACQVPLVTRTKQSFAGGISGQLECQCRDHHFPVAHEVCVNTAHDLNVLKLIFSLKMGGKNCTQAALFLTDLQHWCLFFPPHRQEAPLSLCCSPLSV